MNQDTVRYVALGLLVVVIAIIFLRRRGKKNKGTEDEF
jgi:LPXTG-motif cell wall-anchored protein